MEGDGGGNVHWLEFSTVIDVRPPGLTRAAGRLPPGDGVGDPAEVPLTLFGVLEPYLDGWRAAVPKPEVLPHFPMVLHRGGFPDGS